MNIHRNVYISVEIKLSVLYGYEHNNISEK